MNEKESVIKTFYTAFQQKDYRTMQALYHPEAEFNDPVFQNLAASEVRAMWEMLLTSSRDLKISFGNIRTGDAGGSCDWEAYYTFTLTGRQVHNCIHAEFLISNGKILSHTDTFDLWKWSRMAFGLRGTLLGWSPYMQGKIRQKAGHRLRDFMMKDAVKV